MSSAASPPEAQGPAWGARFGLLVGVAVVAASIAVPMLTGWDVAARRDGEGLAPLHGYWAPNVGPGTVPALLLAVLAWRWGPGVAARLPWRRLLLAAYVVGLAWLLSLAYVDGSDGVTRVLGNPYEYLPTARDVDDVPATLDTFVDRIPYAAEDNWVTHVAGHPPGALLFFVGLVRLGLGGDLAAGLVVTAAAASTAVAVLVALRALGAEALARRAAPFLVLSPAAVFMAVSADAFFAMVAAWGLAALALAATATTVRRAVAWSVAAGLLLGYCVMLSYGLPLLGLIAIAVLIAARSWLPLPVAAITALAVVMGFAAVGFAWWEAYPVLVDRYWDGIAADRPAAYWMWGNLGALLLSAGVLVAAGLGHLVHAGRQRAAEHRVGLLLVSGAALAVLLADLSRLSKAEVERIWLPFIPWLTISLALLPPRWRAWGLGLQLGTALVVQHLLYTSW